MQDRIFQFRKVSLASDLPFGHFGIQDSKGWVGQGEIKSQDENRVIKEGGRRLHGHIRSSFRAKPLITVITAVYNGAEFIEASILSVINQSYDNVQYIIIDGASTDDTLNIIMKYDDRIDYWISEPDTGIYDAINKGVSIVNDGWILVLGADDCLLRGALEKVSKYLSDPNSVYYGNVLMPGWGKVFGGKFSRYRVMYSNIPHQAVFYPAWLANRYKYSLKYRIAGDYELLIKLFCRKELRFVYIPVVVTIYNDENGVSSNCSDKIFYNDKRLLIKQYFPVYLYFLFIVRFFFFEWLEKFGLKSIIKNLFGGILRQFYYQRRYENSKIHEK